MKKSAIIQAINQSIKQAKSEINILEKLAKYDSHNEFNFIQMKDWFDYHVINNQIEHASNELIKIIEKQTEGVLYES